MCSVGFTVCTACSAFVCSLIHSHLFVTMVVLEALAAREAFDSGGWGVTCCDMQNLPVPCHKMARGGTIS